MQRTSQLPRRGRFVLGCLILKVNAEVERGSATSWVDKKIEAIMCFCLKEKNASPHVKATRSGAGK